MSVKKVYVLKHLNVEYFVVTCYIGRNLSDSWYWEFSLDGKQTHYLDSFTSGAPVGFKTKREAKASASNYFKKVLKPKFKIEVHSI